MLSADCQYFKPKATHKTIRRAVITCFVKKHFVYLQQNLKTHSPMSAPFLGLRTVIYRVSDLSAAISWYTNVIGHPPYFNEPYYVGFNVGGFELGLQSEENAGSNKAENIEVYWGVENIEVEYARMLSLGASDHSAPEQVGEDLWVATLKDPWGNLIGLIRNPHFKI
jgi:lactoylglutathione lyase